ncbi:MAG TPA: polysaccharide deacetylase family protein [Terracidiphilus sp.]|nr:polysaccharide deacetylase family protein [Terracidiphilus sp.]
MSQNPRIVHFLLTCAIALAAASAIPTSAVAASKPVSQSAAAPAESSPAKPAPTHFHLKRHPVVALTFDDVPASGGLHVGETRVGIITRLIGELKADHLKGIYGFVNATGISDDPDLQQALRLWVAAGMNIGNHTFDHPALDDTTAEAYIHNIAVNEPTLRQYDPTGDWHWFRYPYLEEGNTLEKREAVRAWLFKNGYRIAQVTLNFQDDDWDDPYGRCLAKHDQAAIDWLKQSYMDNAAEFIRLGRQEQIVAFGHEVPNVLLLHETDFTTLMLPSLIQLLRSQGFRFAPLAKVERNPVYSLDPREPNPGGGSLTNQVLDARHLRYPPFKPEPAEKLDSLCN